MSFRLAGKINIEKRRPTAPRMELGENVFFILRVLIKLNYLSIYQLWMICKMEKMNFGFDFFCIRSRKSTNLIQWALSLYTRFAIYPLALPKNYVRLILSDLRFLNLRSKGYPLETNFEPNFYFNTKAWKLQLIRIFSNFTVSL